MKRKHIFFVRWYYIGALITAELLADALLAVMLLTFVGGAYEGVAALPVIMSMVVFFTIAAALLYALFFRVIQWVIVDEKSITVRGLFGVIRSVPWSDVADVIVHDEPNAVLAFVKSSQIVFVDVNVLEGSGVFGLSDKTSFIMTPYSAKKAAKLEPFWGKPISVANEK